MGQISYRLWVCESCGAFFNVAQNYPDGGIIDGSFCGTGLGFESVSQTMSCCDTPKLSWADAECVRPWISREIPIFDHFDLDDNVTDFPLPEEKKIDRFAYILSSLKRK